MTPRTDGGTAFPARQDFGDEGMSLRDYLAAHCPPCPDWFEGDQRPNQVERLASWPWHYADAVLARRGVK